MSPVLLVEIVRSQVLLGALRLQECCQRLSLWVSHQVISDLGLLRDTASGLGAADRFAIRALTETQGRLCASFVCPCCPRLLLSAWPHRPKSHIDDESCRLPIEGCDAAMGGRSSHGGPSLHTSWSSFCAMWAQSFLVAGITESPGRMTWQVNQSVCDACQHEAVSPHNTDA